MKPVMFRTEEWYRRRGRITWDAVKRTWVASTSVWEDIAKESMRAVRHNLWVAARLGRSK